MTCVRTPPKEPMPRFGLVALPPLSLPSVGLLHCLLARALPTPLQDSTWPCDRGPRLTAALRIGYGRPLPRGLSI